MGSRKTRVAAVLTWTASSSGDFRDEKLAERQEDLFAVTKPMSGLRAVPLSFQMGWWARYRVPSKGCLDSEKLAKRRSGGQG